MRYISKEELPELKPRKNMLYVIIATVTFLVVFFLVLLLLIRQSRHTETEYDEILNLVYQGKPYVMRNLIARLILESYDVAAYVYQKYCVEKQSAEELLENTRLSEQELNMFISYFDVRKAEDKKGYETSYDGKHIKKVCIIIL